MQTKLHTNIWLATRHEHDGDYSVHVPSASRDGAAAICQRMGWTLEGKLYATLHHASDDAAAALVALLDDRDNQTVH